jgi:hypothetical protein
LSKQPMPFRTRVIIFNLAILAGLVLEYYRGAPRLALLIGAAFFFPFTNLVLYLKKLADRRK